MPAPGPLTRRAALAFLAALPALRRAVAQPAADLAPAFPRQPLTLVAPFTPGGPIDVLARVLAQGLQVRTGQPAAVDNRTGGAGNIGIDAVRRAPADGTTMLVIPAGNLTINPTLLRNLPFVVERDFAPVSMLATTPNLIVCAPDFPARNVAELVALAKAQPDRLSYGSPGVGSQLHLAMELFKEKTGTEIAHVPYRGTTQALSDLLGGQIQLLASNLPVVLPAVRDGQLRALAMTTAQRSPRLPDVPTLAEAGVPGIDVTSWYGLLVPRAVPAPVVQAIYEECAKVLRQPEMREKMTAQGLDVVCEPPDVFAERLRRETALWAGVIRERHITVD
ncbi:tripartite tricarboxylate transporter substrate binding protein [Roseomonas sp. NAR14]|uniref:Tripartite tricarboxylate transporter substrate binding protein n=1 Tax=Roseomonas acroporae TaxID=2937791 RepID=A0A9X1Y6M0_9PROT|nr:tripartite tricarboxylate transporter substrate binding protein [Roseomonas acroporae]MCK8784533.1 tripartite tricarboxylate transporter substrate binding protein [Roseomonas acroporae]